MSMSVLVTHVSTMELAPTALMGSRAAVYRDSAESGVKQVSVHMPVILSFGKVACNIRNENQETLCIVCSNIIKN